MRACACATEGLTPCAAAISSASNGSPWRCHQSARDVTEPWCGSGACQAGATWLGAWVGGMMWAQPATINTQTNELIRFMTSMR